ncbi:MAG: aminotransferase class I/II-fold pyridoxal phosphate-dependent enzyme, partial [Bacteroidaceae bacterium]|nr:aminotransferase class I/II-fold pyridoxal phosphate-dependent enzyme [Bacteroidaceae bacterium]
ETWMDGTMVRLSEDNDIVSFIPKKAFKYAEAAHYYKTCNIYKFSREFSCNQYVPFLEAYSKAMGNNEYYEQVLRVLTALDRSDLKALPITNEKWYEIDDVQDLDIAETLFSDEEELLDKYHRRYGGYWRFPQMKDYCYLVNPYYPSERMKDEMRANFDTLLTQYPSGMSVNSLLAGKYFGVSQQYVVVGNGAAELIKSYIEKHVDGNIGIVYPTFEEYPNRAVADRIVRYVPQNADFAYTAADVQTYFSDKEISTLLLINPDNPSGNFIPMADLLPLVEWAGHQGITIIVDESFVDFTDGFEGNSLLHNDILETYGNLVVVKSISKSYGVPGLRLGVLASGNKDLIARMKKEVAIWNINSFAEFYMQIFGKYGSDYTDACHKFIAERCIFFEDLQSVPYLRVIPSQANYFLCEVTGKYTATELTHLLLLRYNILVKDCGTKSAFAGKQYIRIAIRNRADNAFFVEALKDLA